MSTNGNHANGTSVATNGSCCPPNGSSNGNSHNDSSTGVHDSVRDYYSKVLQTSSDLKTNACCVQGRPSTRMQKLLSNIPQPVLDKFYGCGWPALHDLTGMSTLR